MEKDPYLASLEHASTLVGGNAALATRLGVTLDDVLAWSNGERRPDTVNLLRILDVVIAETRNLSRGAMARGLADATLARIAARARASSGE